MPTESTELADTIEKIIDVKVEDQIGEKVSEAISEMPTPVNQQIIEVVPEQLESVREEISEVEDHAENIEDQVKWLRNEMMLMRATLESLIQKPPVPEPVKEIQTEPVIAEISEPEMMTDSNEIKTEASVKSEEESPAKAERVAKVILV
jgi:hypothetical protein